MPKLESLSLAYAVIMGEDWEEVEEGLPQLKFLLQKFMGIEYWRPVIITFHALNNFFSKAVCFWIWSLKILQK